MKPQVSQLLLYILVFLSGIAGLMYQIVWTRMLLLTFGSTTHSVVAVLSAFMAGLAIGSWVIGTIRQSRWSYLRTYAILELAIGLSGLASPFIFSFMTTVYSSIFKFIPTPYVLQMKFIFTFLVLLPPTIAMGATIPLLVEFIKSRFSGFVGTITSRLYAVNTFGACVGVLLTGFYLIETVGLRTTVALAACINLLLAAVVYVWSKKTKSPFVSKSEPEVQNHSNVLSSQKITIALSIFAISGLIGMAYEVAWTRLLTPTTGTYIYAFSSILAVLLFGIAFGSLLYPVFAQLRISPLIYFGFVQIAIGLGALGSLLATSHITQYSQIMTVLLTILPASVGMGLTFPIVASLAPSGDKVSGFVGKSYAINTLGSMIGPLVAGFFLLPAFGVTNAILFLAVLNMIFSLVLFAIENSKIQKIYRFIGLGLGGASLLSVLYLGVGRSELLQERNLHALLQKFGDGQYTWQYEEDETAGVLGYNNNKGDYGLLVDGVGMSVLVDETKLMAHLPMLIHPNPQDVLVIAFGMGTTYRSALTYDAKVDAVELVPSVPNMFKVFYADADQVKANPRGRIIINDGRNYVRLTDKKYDVITVDPPPPVNAAGTTVLYSKEFYEDSQKILKPGGLFTEWFFYGTRADDFQYLLRSFTDVFPYVAVFGSPRAIGIYLIGSDQPILINQNIINERFKNPKVRADLNEWGYWDEKNTPSLYFGDKSILLPFIGDAPPVTDDRPRTEYFRLRHKTPSTGIARNEVLFPNRY